jgi:hypothetical protein
MEATIPVFMQAKSQSRAALVVASVLFFTSAIHAARASLGIASGRPWLCMPSPAKGLGLIVLRHNDLVSLSLNAPNFAILHP